MSALRDLRAERKLTLAQLAVELGLSASSAGWLSEIENGLKDASIRLALKIESWSGGKVKAASVCSELRAIQVGHAAPPSDAPTLAAEGALGAGKNDGNVSRTGMGA